MSVQLSEKLLRENLLEIRDRLRGRREFDLHSEVLHALRQLDHLMDDVRAERVCRTRTDTCLVGACHD